ncbi:MAG: hypothetical protein ACIARR_04435 [Phycisphaerales bacterium JB059]
MALAAMMLSVSIGVLPTPASIARLVGVVAPPAYPCAGGMCGCSSARACWTTCQCQPLSAKVAWAHRHGVEIPAYVDLSERALARSTEAPACPLCPGAEGASVANGEPSPLPSMSALRCRGIELLMVVPVAPATTRAQLDRVLAPASRVIPRLRDQVAPDSRCIDAPTPPPRSAAA